MFFSPEAASLLSSDDGCRIDDLLSRTFNGRENFERFSTQIFFTEERRSGYVPTVRVCVYTYHSIYERARWAADADRRARGGGSLSIFDAHRSEGKGLKII